MLVNALCCYRMGPVSAAGHVSHFDTTCTHVGALSQGAITTIDVMMSEQVVTVGCLLWTRAGQICKRSLTNLKLLDTTACAKLSRLITLYVAKGHGACSRSNGSCHSTGKLSAA
jgi:hypothetical protein